MLMKNCLRALALVGVACALAACGDEDNYTQNRGVEYMHGITGGSDGGANEAYNQHSSPEDSVSYWDGDGVPGAPRIEVRIGEQRAYYYKGDQLVGVSQVSTGKEGHDTPSGDYKVLQKDKDHRSSLYGDYVDAHDQNVVVKANVENGKDPRPPGTVFLGSAMPNFLRVTNGVGLHTGYLPGVPASHGCIRMPGFMAENFFNNTPLGTPVTITK